MTIKEKEKTAEEWLIQAMNNLEDARYSFAVFVDLMKRWYEKTTGRKFDKDEN